MKFAKRYILLDEHRYNALETGTGASNSVSELRHPSIKSIAEEGREMKTILADDSLTDFEKMQKHSQSLIKYLDSFRDALTIPSKQALIGDRTAAEMGNVARETPSQPKVAPDKAEPSIARGKAMPMNRILQSQPYGYKTTAKTLLGKLGKLPDFTWDEKGVVRSSNTILSGQDISRLVRDSVLGSTGDVNKQLTGILTAHSGANKRGGRKQTGEGIRRFRSRLSGKWIGA